MTSVLKEDDKIFTMYKQYKEFIHKDAEKSGDRVYGTDQLAAQLTIAHMLDHVTCLFKKQEPPTARKVNGDWKKVVVLTDSDTTSSSADVEIDWERMA